MRRLPLALLLLVLAAPSEAQTDWYQEMINATILSGGPFETWMAQADGNTFYVAVGGVGGKSGIQGNGNMGNGSFVVDGQGNITDCAVQPAVCRQMLEDAANGGNTPTEPPTETTPPEEGTPPGQGAPPSEGGPPAGTDPPKQEAQDGTYWSYSRQFEVVEDGTVRFHRRPTRRSGAWTVVFTKQWYDARRGRR